MERIAVAPRPNWKARVEEIGFDFHTLDGRPYWDESAYWKLTEAEVDLLDEASVELHKMCLAAAEHIVTNRLYPLLGIRPDLADKIAASWEARDTRDFHLYGRFDLAFGGAGVGDGQPKLLEYNADTPTGLFEASVVQWHWLQDLFADKDQFNSIHEGLVERWGELLRRDRSLAADGARHAAGETGNTLHLTCLMPSLEDEGTLRYLQDTALEAGLATKTIALGDIGWTDSSDGKGWFVDLEDQPMTRLFKLTPWEWLVEDPFGKNLIAQISSGGMLVVEPLWKMLLSNKGLLAVLWEMFPYHPYLAQASFDRTDFAAGTKVVAKPLLGREGSNVSIAEIGEGGKIVGAPLVQTSGPYGAEGWVYQALVPMASARDAKGVEQYAVLGAWIIGDKCRGLGIREDETVITHNTSRFVPHLFE